MSAPTIDLTPIDGVLVVNLAVHDDSRGSFSELWRRSWVEGAPEMIQSNRSDSEAGVLRGLHFHRRQTDYWVLAEGRVFVGLYDFRSASHTLGAGHTIVLDAREPRGLYIPPGVAHGFYAVEPSALVYLVDAYYDGDDEFGVAWDDPEIGIDWPATEPILSERDSSNPRLAEIAPEARP